MYPSFLPWKPSFLYCGRVGSKPKKEPLIMSVTKKAAKKPTRSAQDICQPTGPCRLLDSLVPGLLVCIFTDPTQIHRDTVL